MDRKWKLGDDLHESDSIMDGISFDDLIVALHCGEKTIDVNAVNKAYNDMLMQRHQDAMFLLKNNMSEIIRRALRGRENY